MSIIKRLSATLHSSLDRIVSDIENHDAVIEATMKELQKKIAEAQVRSNRINNESRQLESQLTQSNQDSERWRQRALQCAKQDETRALQCLSRARDCERESQHLQLNLQEYQQNAEKLNQDIRAAEQRLRDVKQKYHLMRARQSTAAAMHASADVGNESMSELADTFERWECRLREAEMSLDSHAAMDSLEHDFAKQEQDQELRQELERLLAQQEETAK